MGQQYCRWDDRVGKIWLRSQVRMTSLHPKSAKKKGIVSREHSFLVDYGPPCPCRVCEEAREQQALGMAPVEPSHHTYHDQDNDSVPEELPSQAASSEEDMSPEDYERRYLGTAATDRFEAPSNVTTPVPRVYGKRNLFMRGTARVIGPVLPCT